MTKLVWGVGINDLGYRTQAEEELTKNGGKRIRKIVFRCKYYEAWTNMLKRCYSKNTWKANQAILAQAYAASGYMPQNLKDGWSNKTGMVSA